ncbi:hypothetical protein Bca101_030422 [Brassica carinata]
MSAIDIFALRLWFSFHLPVFCVPKRLDPFPLIEMKQSEKIQELFDAVFKKWGLEVEKSLRSNNLMLIFAVQTGRRGAFCEGAIEAERKHKGEEELSLSLKIRFQHTELLSSVIRSCFLLYQ